MKADYSSEQLTLPEPRLTIDNGRCFCRVYGQGDPIMLIHGNRGSGYSFYSIIPFMKQYMLIIPDLPFHGNGPKMLDEFFDNPQLAVEYCFYIADLLSIDRFAVVGHSLGGMIGLSMYLSNARRINSIVLLDSFVDYKERPPELFKIAPFDNANDTSRQQIEDCCDDGPGVRWHEWFDVSAQIPEFKCPVLELQGEANPDTEDIFTCWLMQKRRSVPDTWLIARIPNAAHFLQFENIDAVMCQILPFLVRNKNLYSNK